ncbi:MAG: recombinase family protein [Candidatus Thiodiazotropha sp. (ex Lucinoma borealis)]|nr:recombinase family protein [Candidatus Thiodiazotropha sp. (ex Lucinoma borealis)]
MKKCFGYIRVSTVKQGEGVSLTAQKQAIEGFAQRERIEISAWYEEKETAAKSGRPVFNAMVKALKAKKASGMIIHRIDRSSRNLKDWATISELSDAGIDVYFATETLDFRSRGGRLTADIQAVIAADYIRNLSIEARKGINGRLKQGLYPWPAPLGYLNNGSGKPKTLDPIRAPLVRELFEYYLTGDYSIRTLHTTMVKRGLTNTNNKPISKRAVEVILQNPFYCGLMRNGRTGELFPGIHKKLISASQFKRIADIKAGRYVKKTTRHNHLLRRLFFCATCGVVLSPEMQKGRVYYRCHTVSCPINTAREDYLEAAIYQKLHEYQFSDADRERFVHRLETWEDNTDYEDVTKSVDLRITQAETRLDRVTDLFIDEKIDQPTHEKKRTALLIEIEKLKEERADIDEKPLEQEERQEFFELMKNLAELYKESKPTEKRTLVENCFSNRKWDGKYVYLEPSELISTVKNGTAVPYGGPFRDRIRTFIDELDKARNEQKPDEDEYVWESVEETIDGGLPE